MEREPASGTQARLDDIVEAGRRTRRRTPRGLWIAALIIGAVCAIGFVAVLLGDPAPATAARPAQPARGLGFSLGLVVGVALGIAIGLAIARAQGRAGDRDRAGDAHRPVADRHSSRSRP